MVNAFGGAGAGGGHVAGRIPPRSGLTPAGSRRVPNINSKSIGELSTEIKQAGWAWIMLCQREPYKLRTCTDFEHEHSERINVLRGGRFSQTACSKNSEATIPLLTCQKSQKLQQALRGLRPRVSVHNKKGYINHKFHFLASTLLCSDSA